MEEILFHWKGYYTFRLGSQYARSGLQQGVQCILVHCLRSEFGPKTEL